MKSLFLLSVFLAVALSMSSSVNFTDDFTVDYYTEEVDGVQSLYITMNMKNLDYSEWTTTGTGPDGFWMGYGLGTEMFDEADLVICTFVYEGLGSKTFKCYDMWSDSLICPPEDTHTSDITWFNEQATYDEATKKVSFSLTIGRYFDTGDTYGEDY